MREDLELSNKHDTAMGPWWSNEVIGHWVRNAQQHHNKQGDYVVAIYDYDGIESYLEMKSSPPAGWQRYRAMKPEAFKRWRSECNDEEMREIERRAAAREARQRSPLISTACASQDSDATADTVDHWGCNPDRGNRGGNC